MAGKQSTEVRMKTVQMGFVNLDQDFRESDARRFIGSIFNKSSIILKISFLV